MRQLIELIKLVLHLAFLNVSIPLVQAFIELPECQSFWPIKGKLAGRRTKIVGRIEMILGNKKALLEQGLG